MQPIRPRQPIPPALALLLMAVTGCGSSSPQPVPSTPPVVSATAPMADRADTRSRWVYESGWFAKGVGDSWYEHNEAVIRERGKAWEFRQTDSSPGSIVLYDASRGVSVRLSASRAEVRWDSEGSEALWKPLLVGKWDAQP